jgi:hypothetical protein
LSAPPVLAEFTFDGPRFFGAAVDKLGNTTIAQSGADAVAGGPASIAIKVSIDHGKSFALLPIKLTRDSGWHQVSVDLSKVAGLSAAAGASIVLTAAKGADVGTLSIDDVRIVGVK